MESTFPIKAKTICRSLISSWSNLPLQEINVESVSNGRSNRLFICSRSSATSSDLTTEPKSSSVGSGQPVACSSTGHLDQNIDSSKSGQVDRYSKVIVRFYGSEFTGEGNQYKCVSDDEEMEILKILSARGISPAVLKSFPGGRIDEYIESTILNPKRIAQIDILTILAPKIAQYHVTRFKCEKVYDLVQICRDNITKATEILSNYTETRLADYSEPTALLLRKVKQFYMDKPATRLIEKMTLTKQKNVFAHIDLNYTNFLFPKEIDNLSSTIKSSFDVMIIDVENSQNNFRGIDLGKFFSELCIGDGKSDLNYIPDSSIDSFIDSYLNEWKVIVDPEQFDSNTDNHKHLALEIKLGFLFHTVFHMTWNVTHANFDSSDLLNDTSTRIDIFNHYNQRWSQLIQ